MAGSKYDVTAIVADHVGTLSDARTGRRRRRDYLTQFGVPLVLGLVVGATTWVTTWIVTDFAAIIGGVAVLTGFLFGLAMFAFQLRLSVTQDPRLSQSMTVKQRLDELFRNVNYAVLIGLLATVTIMAASSVSSSARWWQATRTGLVVVLIGHLVLVMFMCLKRLRGAYRALN